MLSTIVSVFVVFLAGLGGLVVFLGLLFEKQEGGKKQFANIEEKRRSEARMHLGEQLVLWGVLAEAIIAMGLAVGEAAELRNAFVAANNANPTNQSVTELFARVVVNVNGPMIELPKYEAKTGTFLELNEENVGTFNLGSRRLLLASDIQPFNSYGSDGKTKVVNHGYNVRFRNDDFLEDGDPVTLEGKPITGGVVINRIKWVRIYCPFIQPHEDILSGGMELVVNGGLKKRFKIPPQKTDTNILGWGDRDGSSLYATNEPAITH